MSHNPHLLHALGTRHCPNCHFPLFANPYAPGDEGDRTAQERWLGDFVMLVDDALAAPQRLIACAEALPLWSRAAVVGDGGTDTEPEIATRRGNDRLSVTGFLHPDLTEHEQQLQRVLHQAASRYVRRIGSLKLGSDLGFELLRYGPGQRYTEHVDSMPGSASVYGQRLLSAVLYLNDDYQGGELHFPRQGLTYNPRAGSLLLFPSNFCYPHESLPIRLGTKYAVVTWFI
jgi:predicted 2-oxoglutarate/Fe(II)-dependent dioxygenase YbiX